MLAQRLITGLCLLTIGLFIFTKPAFAQSPQSSTLPSQAATTTVSNYPPQSPQFMNLMIFNFAHTLSCLAEGISIIGQPCLTLIPFVNDKRISLIPQETIINQGGGILGGFANLLSLSFATPPLKSSEYLADLGKKLNPVQPAYAQVQGSGSTIIRPVMVLWQVSRNLAYLGMTAIFLIVGLMIMFRRKLNPQTVISVQNALPGLIIGLVLITFSYFLTALLVDTSFISTQLVRQIFISAGITQTSGSDSHLSGNIFSVFSNYLNPNGDEAWKVAQETSATLSFLKQGTTGTIIMGISAMIGCKIGQAFGGMVSAGSVVGSAADLALTPAAKTLGPVTGLLLGGSSNPVGRLVGCGVGSGLSMLAVWQTSIVEFIMGLLLYVVLLLALLMTMFKIFFSIVTAYTSIIVLTLTAPLRFLLASVPGSKSSVTNWLKEMLANLLIFPVYYLTFFVSAFILGGSIAGSFGIDTAKFGTPDFSNGAVPFLGNISTAFLRVALGYGLILLSPNIPDMIKGALGVKDPGYGKIAVGAAIGGFGLGKNFLNRSFDPLMKERKAFAEGMYKRKIMNYEDPKTGNDTANPLVRLFNADAGLGPRVKT